LTRLRARLDSRGTLTIVSSSERSQFKNRADALQRLKDVVAKAMAPRKVRKPSKPTKGSKVRRIVAKKQKGELKSSRKRPSRFDE
jgi:ribosome-associated protein